MAELENENRKMREPLEAAKREMEELRRRADNYDKMKTLYEVSLIRFNLKKLIISIDFKTKKAQFKTCEADLKNAKWEYEVLLQRFEIVRNQFFIAYSSNSKYLDSKRT